MSADADPKSAESATDDIEAPPSKAANGGDAPEGHSASLDVESKAQTGPLAGEKPTKPVPYLTLYRFADKWDKFWIVVGVLGAIGNGAAMPVFSILFGNLMNAFGQNLDNYDELTDEVNAYCLYFLYLAIGSMVAAFFMMFCFTYTGVRQVNRIRHRYLAAVLRQDVGFFDVSATSGRLLQGLNEDCITIQLAVGDKVAFTLFNLGTFFVGIIIALARGWDMALVLLAVTPLLALMGFLVSVFMTKATAVMNRAYGDANSIAQQALGNVRTVYSFNAEQRTLNAYDAALEEPVKVGIKQGFISGVTVGATNGAAFCAYALALWYGSTRVAAGAYTGGDVLNVLFAALIGGFALGQAAPNLQYFQQGKAAGGRVFEIMHRRPAADVDGPGQVLNKVEGNLEFFNVTFAYPSRPDVPIFRNFTLDVPAGKTVALVGESGSGKSTAIQLVERFYDPQGGKVLLDGADLRSLQLRWLRSQIGLVSQEPTLFATSILKNILYGRPGATQEEVVAACKSANAHSFIMGLPCGYDTHVGEKGVQMSGGQKQRIAIARAILKDPRVLLLDEATSALDAQSEHVVQEALDRLMVGRTTLVVAHRLSTIRHADTIAVVKRGRIVEQGTHAELQGRAGIYAAMVSMQQAEGPPPGEEEEGDDESALVEARGRSSGHLSRVSEDRASSEGDRGSLDSRAAAAAASSQPGGAKRAKPPLEGLAEVAEGAADLAVDRLAGGVRGLGQMDANQYAPTRMVVPVGGGYATGGWKKFISFQRKPTFVRDRPVALEEARPAGSDASSDTSSQSGEGEGSKAKAKGKKKKSPAGFRRLAALNRPELPAALSGLLGAGVLGAAMPVFAIAFSSLINVFYLPPSEVESQATKWSLIFVAIGVGMLLASIASSFSFNYMGQKLARRVRLLMLGTLLRQEVGWYDREENSSGVLSSKLSADALAVKGQFGDTMGLLTQNLVTLAGGYIVAFKNGWRMTLVVTSCVPIIGMAAYVQTKLILVATQSEDESFAMANQTATEAFTNIRTIAAFGMEENVSELYAQKLGQPTREARKRAVSSGCGFGVSQFALFATYSLAFWYGGLEVTRGVSTFEEVLKVFFAIFLAAFGAAQAQLFFPDVAKGKAAVERVFKIIDRRPRIDAGSEGGEQPAKCAGAIKLEAVTFAYPQRPEVTVFRSFSLDIPAGRTVALVGESGSGKSTVVSLIQRFYDPVSGRVLLDGWDLRDLNVHWLRAQIGLVGQEPVLFNATVAENIRYGAPDASAEAVEAAARAANAHAFIEALPEGYATRLGEGGVQLSGGQKQRVAIARAVVRDPRVLLLDEATSALDAESEHLVQEALDRLMPGRTSVVVAHRLSTVRNADSIAVVYRGRIIEQGSHTELMASPHGAYAKLVRHQLTRGTRSTTLGIRA